jgi:hypothetical protein
MRHEVGFILAYELLGSNTLEKSICFASKVLNADAVILLGDTASPSIITSLYNKCGIRVLGVLGSLDEASVAHALKSVQGLLDCRAIEFGGVLLYGYGVGTCVSSKPSTEVDILFSSKPGCVWGCCRPCSDVVDSVCNIIKPKLVVTGGCKYPCSRGRAFSPGSARLGYFAILKYNTEDESYVVLQYQLDVFLFKLLKQ